MPVADAAPMQANANRGGHLRLVDATMFRTPAGAGGVRRVLDAKRDGLRARGWEHVVVAPLATQPHERACGGLPIPGSGGYRFVAGRSRAARIIEAAAPDIVEAADPSVLAWAVLDATARLRVPAVAFCHSDLPRLAARLVGGPAAASTWRGRWSERRAAEYLARLYGRFDLVLAPSRAMTRRLREIGVAHAQHQPLGVDCTVFSPAAAAPQLRERLPEALGLAPDTRLLVYAGRFAPEKNLQVLADAVARLGPGHALVAMGAGPCPPTGTRVRLLPPGEPRQVARLLAGADAFVHAGDQETFGLAALEAMACGTPVVVHAGGGLGELAQGVGIVVPSLHPEVWAEAIRAALEHSASALTWAGLARARAHDWSLVVEQWAARYRQAIREHERARSLGALVAPPQPS